MKVLRTEDMEEAWIQALENRKKQNLENKISRPIHEVQGNASAPVRGEKNNFIPQRGRTNMRFKTTEEDKKDIQRKAIAPNEIGKVEEDPTQGWGNLANAEMGYNRLPSSQDMKTQGYAKAFKKAKKK